MHRSEQVAVCTVDETLVSQTYSLVRNIRFWSDIVARDVGLRPVADQLKAAANNFALVWLSLERGTILPNSEEAEHHAGCICSLLGHLHHDPLIEAAKHIHFLSERAKWHTKDASPNWQSVFEWSEKHKGEYVITLLAAEHIKNMLNEPCYRNPHWIGAEIGCMSCFIWHTLSPLRPLQISLIINRIASLQANIVRPFNYSTSLDPAVATAIKTLADARHVWLKRLSSFEKGDVSEIYRLEADLAFRHPRQLPALSETLDLFWKLFTVADECHYDIPQLASLIYRLSQCQPEYMEELRGEVAYRMADARRHQVSEQSMCSFISCFKLITDVLTFA